MYNHILIATEGSDLGNRAVDHGLALAKAVKARVTLITVTESWSAFDLVDEALQENPDPLLQFRTMAAAQGKRILDAAAAKAKAAGVTYEVIHVPDHHPSDGILETAEREGVDLIVMTSHGRRGIGRLLLGSQAYEVLAQSKVPVLIAR
jgi:nucleotide-binding universal stress UspA family protein